MILGRCLRGDEMNFLFGMITGVIILIIAFFVWAMCASIPYEPWDDEEQQQYVDTWKEKQNKHNH